MKEKECVYMFSVIVPAYNCEKTITLTLDSILRQTRIDLIDEVIIVNDGSTDNTKQVLEEYLNNCNVLIYRLINQDNSGVSKARNRGIREAKSEWIALIDSDDIWHENRIERQVKVLEENPHIVFLGSSYPVQIYFSNYYYGLHKISAKQLCLRNFPCTPSVV